ncbi:MAG: ABC transporter ATP-binding protein [Kiloniellales bacterium]|nr:ABC transporter ATP-binding protein [Kiloniellales bacterium]
MENLLEIRGLTKRFGPVLAVDKVSFTVERGEVLGFLGPNGAGKSTTMKMITGFLAPSAGTALVAGHDVVVDPLEAKRRIGYLPEGAPAYGDMTPASLLDFVAEVRGLTGVRKAERRNTVIDRLQLGTVLERPIETLSKGFKRRVGLAQAILLDPEILILDEPTDGLDPNQKHEVRGLLNEMAGDKAIVISTHILEEVEAVCSRAIIIAGGKIVADAEPEALKARSARHKAVALRLKTADAARGAELLSKLDAVTRVETVRENGASTEILAYPSNGQDILAPVHGSLAEAGVEVEEIFLERGRLDEVFRQLTATA